MKTYRIRGTRWPVIAAKIRKLRDENGPIEIKTRSVYNSETKKRSFDVRVTVKEQSNA